MSPPRFYFPQLSNASHFHMEGAEARHAISVLRLVQGDRVSLFDGIGGEILARIGSVNRNAMELELIDRTDTNRELPFALELAIALPKGDRQRILIDAATELGVTKLIPLRTHRGVAQPTENALERLSRSVIEACKQSGRNRLMEIASPSTVSELANASGYEELANASAPLRLVAHLHDEVGPRMNLYRTLIKKPPRAAILVIGPEGGLTNEEVVLLNQSGWNIVDLGKAVLRVEIAAIAAVAQVASWQHQFGVKEQLCD